MTHSHHNLNIQQYQDKSSNYLHSTVHAQGNEFAKMRQLIKDYQLAHLLDLGCGGGHVSYQIAEVSQSVTAYDITPAMTELVQQQAHARGRLWPGRSSMRQVGKGLRHVEPWLRPVSQPSTLQSRQV